jgi:hypothetical protein
MVPAPILKREDVPRRRDVRHRDTLMINMRHHMIDVKCCLCDIIGRLDKVPIMDSIMVRSRSQKSKTRLWRDKGRIMQGPLSVVSDVLRDGRGGLAQMGNILDDDANPEHLCTGLRSIYIQGNTMPKAKSPQDRQGEQGEAGQSPRETLSPTESMARGGAHAWVGWGWGAKCIGGWGEDAVVRRRCGGSEERWQWAKKKNR